MATAGIVERNWHLLIMVKWEQEQPGRLTIATQRLVVEQITSGTWSLHAFPAIDQRVRIVGGKKIYSFMTCEFHSKMSNLKTMGDGIG